MSRLAVLSFAILLVISLIDARPRGGGVLISLFLKTYLKLPLLAPEVWPLSIYFNVYVSNLI